jgi:putative transposase
MKQKCNEYDYSQFLIATQGNYTCTEFEKVTGKEMSHDSPTRLLKKERLTPRILWKKVRALIQPKAGFLIIDDSIIDKPRTKKSDLIRWQYSGTHHDVVKGIGLETLLWTNQDNEHIPVDYRFYAKDTDGKTKNQHFVDMIKMAKYRGFKPELVLGDSWYSSLENLKTIRKLEWHWMMQLRKNRVVSTAPHQATNLEKLDIPPEGMVVWLRGYGEIKVFKSVSKKGGVAYYGTSKLNLTKSGVKRIYSKRWQIEEYHRGLKQQCGVAKCQARTERSQRNHIFCSIQAFLALEVHRLKTGVTWQQAKLSITRDAIRNYLLNPRIGMVSA